MPAKSRKSLDQGKIADILGSDSFTDLRTGKIKSRPQPKKGPSDSTDRDLQIINELVRQMDVRIDRRISDYENNRRMERAINDIPRNGPANREEAERCAVQLRSSLDNCGAHVAGVSAEPPNLGQSVEIILRHVIQSIESVDHIGQQFGVFMPQPEGPVTAGPVKANQGPLGGLLALLRDKAVELDMKTSQLRGMMG